MFTPHNRRSFLAGLGAAALISGFGLIAPAQAHEAPCPMCSQPITQDTAERDNEVVLKVGRKRIEYKCVFCALHEAASEYKGDLVVLAPSEKKGEPIKFSREGGNWSTSASEVAFVAQRASHKICQDTYRAFSTPAAADAYIAANKETVGETKPLTLAQMLERTGNAKKQ